MICQFSGCEQPAVWSQERFCLCEIHTSWARAFLKDSNKIGQGKCKQHYFSTRVVGRQKKILRAWWEDRAETNPAVVAARLHDELAACLVDLPGAPGLAKKELIARGLITRGDLFTPTGAAVRHILVQRNRGAAPLHRPAPPPQPPPQPQPLPPPVAVSFRRGQVASKTRRPRRKDTPKRKEPPVEKQEPHQEPPRPSPSAADGQQISSKQLEGLMEMLVLHSERNLKALRIAAAAVDESTSTALADVKKIMDWIGAGMEMRDFAKQIILEAIGENK